MSGLGSSEAGDGWIGFERLRCVRMESASLVEEVVVCRVGLGSPGLLMPSIVTTIITDDLVQPEFRKDLLSPPHAEMLVRLCFLFSASLPLSFLLPTLLALPPPLFATSSAISSCIPILIR